MIRIYELYQGTPSNEQRILPGDYDDEDPRLFGIADYLVKNGFATRLDAPVVESEWVAAAETAFAKEELVDAITDGIRAAIDYPSSQSHDKPKPKRR